MRPDQVPLAIGKNAANLKLASLLTGYRIEVFRDGDAEEDIYIDEFSDEIDTWILGRFKENDYTTAKAVLRASREELLEKTDLEEETLDHVLSVLAAEFSEEELAEEPAEEGEEEEA